MSKVKHPDIAVKLVGENGNIYNLMGIVIQALNANGFSNEVDTFTADITSSRSYDDALCKIMQWVNVY